MEEKDLYEKGEEKFGFFTSRGYSISRIVPTMRHFYRFVLNDLKKFEFETLIDIGSGDGYVLSRMASIDKGKTLVGLDPSPHMVYVSSRKWRNVSPGRLKFVAGSSREIPETLKGDLIYTTLSFHHWKDREKSVPYVMEHLNSGGVFNIYEVEYNGELSRRFVRSHTVKRELFEKIGKELNVKYEIVEDNGFIRCSFKK
ncbi:MAG: class I SAM-dependent methyltransferase [Candidatus Thermoplasmatota archaeon]|jgi:trans-aconitate methyltransferase|nr:class I SAM-dependent methyltransferase [Candidatus Thermoplasmatota archaeon]